MQIDDSSQLIKILLITIIKLYNSLFIQSPQRWNYTWTTVRNATVDGNMCLQIHGSEISGSEDCLYLNIFIPYVSYSKIFYSAFRYFNYN